MRAWKGEWSSQGWKGGWYGGREGRRGRALGRGSKARPTQGAAAPQARFTGGTGAAYLADGILGGLPGLLRLLSVGLPLGSAHWVGVAENEGKGKKEESSADYV